MRLARQASQPRARTVTGLPLKLALRRADARGGDRGRNRLKPEMVQFEDRQLLATFTVSSTLDTVTSGVPATGTLRWAVEQADLSGGTDVIDFNSTVFDTPQMIMFGSGNGAIAMTAAAATITIDGPGTGLLTVSGNNTPAVFQVNSGVTAAISGLTMTGGSGGSDAVDDLGSVTLSNCALIDGRLTVGGSAAVSECTITGNNNFSSGGVYVKAGATVSVTGCTISGTASTVGVQVWNAGTATLTDCTVAGNPSPGSGTGLCNIGKLMVKDCTITGNYGTGVINDAGTAYISGSTISGNSGSRGGNIFSLYGTR